MNDPDIVPPATVHTGLDMRPLGVEEIAQGPVSPAAKFEPMTRTVIPGGPEVGVNATEALTKKLAAP